jgi:hypothetical protein
MSDDERRSPFVLGDLSSSLRIAKEEDKASSDKYYGANLPPHGHSSQFSQDSLLLSTGQDADDTVEENSGAGRERKKRKRNKPTLSCKECVEKKIRVRPISLFTA